MGRVTRERIVPGRNRKRTRWTPLHRDVVISFLKLSSLHFHPTHSHQYSRIRKSKTIDFGFEIFETDRFRRKERNGSIGIVEISKTERWIDAKKEVDEISLERKKSHNFYRIVLHNCFFTKKILVIFTGFLPDFYRIVLLPRFRLFPLKFLCFCRTVRDRSVFLPPTTQFGIVVRWLQC